MTATTGSQPRQSHEGFEGRAGGDRPGEQTDLQAQYRKIGISAVAAALRYCGEDKNPTSAPSETQIDERFIEIAA